MSNSPEPDDFPPGEIIAEIHCHFLYWTRKLRPVLTPEMLARAREEMDQALYPVAGEALAAGGTENHLHVLARLSPEHSVQEAIDALRRRLEAWTAPESRGGRSPWHEEDVAVTVGPDELPAAREYIESQESHHAIVPFASELKALFREHGFPHDERDLLG